MSALGPLAVLLCLGSRAPGAAAPRPVGPDGGEVRYRIHDLGTLGGAQSRMLDLSENGYSCGWAEDAKGRNHPVVWHGRKSIDLGPGQGAGGAAGHVNASGQATGVFYSAADETPLAFFWDGEKVRMLPDLGGGTGTPYDLNAAGTAVGKAETAAHDRHACLWKDGKVTDLGTLGGAESVAYALNDREQVVGYSDTAERGPEGFPISHAFLWEAGHMTDLGALEGGSSAALDINNQGQVAGNSTTAGTTPQGNPVVHAFLWESGNLRDLGSLGGQSEAAFINDQGQVAGRSTLDFVSVSSHPVLWQNGELLDLFGPSSGHTGDYGLVTDLNNPGRVVIGTLAGPAVWSEGQLTDLFAAAPGGSGWQEGDVFVNEAGDLAGFAKRGHFARAFVVVPGAPPPADIRLTLTPSIRYPHTGDTVTFTGTLTNQGPNRATGVCAEMFAYSTGMPWQPLRASPEFFQVQTSTGDYAVGWEFRSLAPGQSVQVKVSVKVKGTGPFYVLARVGSEGDYRPANNAVELAVRVVRSGAVDLVGEWRQAAISGAEPYRLRGVFNLHFTAKPSRRATTQVRFYVSDNAFLDDRDVLLKRVPIRGLRGGQNVGLTVDAPLPEISSTTGLLFVLAVVDPDDQVQEADENNVFLRQID